MSIFYNPLQADQKKQLLDILGEDGSGIADIDGAIAYLETIRRMQEVRFHKNKFCKMCTTRLRKWTNSGNETESWFCPRCDGLGNLMN